MSGVHTINIDDLINWSQNNKEAPIGNKIYEINFTKWIKGSFGSKSVELLPQIRQNTDKFRSCKLEFFKSASNNLSTIAGINSGQANVLTEWGQPSSPLLGPLEDNSQLRESLGTRSPTDEEIRLFKNFVRKCLDSGSFESVHLRRVSHSGFPFFVTGIDFKLDSVRRDSKICEQIRDVVCNDDIDGQLKLKIGNFFTGGVRIQSENVKINDNGQPFTKKRLAFDKSFYEELEDRNNNAHNANESQVIVDYTVYNEANQPDNNFVAGRARSMYGKNRSVNFPLQILNNRIMNGLKEFCKIADYKGELVTVNLIRERMGMKKFQSLDENYVDAEIVRATPELNGQEGNIVCLDKTNFGETFCPELLEAFISVLSDMDPSLGLYVRKCIDAPVLLRSLYANENDPFITRKNFSKEEHLSLRGSFKSGDGLVACLNSLLGIFDALLMLREFYKTTFHLERFYNNSDMRYFCLNKGDDTFFWFSSTETASAFKKFIEKRTGLHKDEIESKNNFLGVIYLSTGYFTRDLLKLGETSFGSERSYRLKTYPQIGWYSRDKAYLDCNYLAADLIELREKIYYDEYKFSIRDYYRAVEGLELRPDDMLFLANPDRLVFGAVTDVTPALIQEEFEIVSADNCAHFLSKMFPGWPI